MASSLDPTSEWAEHWLAAIDRGDDYEQTFRANHPSRVLVTMASPVGRQSGLLSDSVVMTDNLATITEAAIHRVIGTLSMTTIDVALRYTLAL